MRARRLRGIIKKLELNQSDLARSSKINRSTLNFFLHGRVKLSAAQLTALEVATRAVASRQLEQVLEVLAPVFG
jgi:transcriptional regulator with XRE-family HTH domain